MAIKEFETALQILRDNSGKTHPWYMRGKASIDDSGNITTVTHLESHVDLSGFTGGMYAQFVDSNGSILFQTPLLQYGVDGRKVPPFIGTPSPRTVNCSFKVDPSVFAQVDSCAIQLFHAPKNRLPDILKRLPLFVNLILKIVGVDFSSSPGSEDISVMQSGLNGGGTVYALHDGGSKAGEIIATWNHTRSPKLTASSKIVPVTVFEHSNYGGRSQSFEVGSYDKNRLTVGNDKISSLRVTNGYRVKLFQDDGFKGATRTYSSDMASLPDFNDKTSSLIVEQVAVNNGPVTVYEHSNYEGRSQTFDVGSYDLIRLTIGNDIISSVRVANGYKVTLFEHAGFNGATRTYSSNTPSLPDFNDKTSSLIVEKVTVNNPIDPLNLDAIGIYNSDQVKIIYDSIFSPVTYAKSYSDLMAAFGDGTGGHESASAIRLWNHFRAYVLSGNESNRLLGFSPVFEPIYYFSVNGDVRRDAHYGRDHYAALGHFVQHGMQEGRDSHPNFNVNAYRSRYSDLQDAFGSDMRSYYRHFVRHGLSEGRNPQRL